MGDIADTLKERGNVHGLFSQNSNVAQLIKESLKEGINWDDMRPVYKEALEMIAHKMARIVCGSPEHIDNWHDIAGYSTLVERELEKGIVDPI